MGPPMMLPLHELNLSEAQDKKVHEIFERYRPKLDALLNETFPKVRTVNEQIERDVREVLTEEQRRTLDRAKPSRHGGPHDGPPPPRHGEPGDWPPPPGLRPEEHPGPLPSGSASDPTTPAPVPPEASGR
jgi:Spy/CpxP family protein refolding chaperone